MGVKLMPMPETFMNCTVTAPRYQDLQAMIEEVNYLEDSLLVGMPFWEAPLAVDCLMPVQLLNLCKMAGLQSSNSKQFVTAQGKPCLVSC